jgi:hypothetical protein
VKSSILPDDPGLPPDDASAEMLMRAMGGGAPEISDLGAIRKTALLALLGFIVLALAMLGLQSGSDIWLWLVGPALLGTLGGMIVLFGFGLLAAVRRGTYWMIVLGIVLTPFAFFVWAEVLRQRGDPVPMTGEREDETGEEAIEDLTDGSPARAVRTERRSWFERSD